MNTVSIIGNLTRDPELRHTASDYPVASLRVAVNEREKRDDEWVDRANYFDVTVWGRQAETAVEYLSKGKRVGVTGRLRWEEWETEDGAKRQTVKIVAVPGGIDFLTPKGSSSGDSYEPESDDDDDDIPF